MKQFRLLLVSLALCLQTGIPFAQETATLTAPEQPPSNAVFHTERITLDMDGGTIHIQLKGQNGEAMSCLYTPSTNPTGTFLINALNKANLSSAYNNNATTGSLKQRIFHRLVVMNEAAAVCGRSIIGTLTGSVP